MSSATAASEPRREPRGEPRSETSPTPCEAAGRELPRLSVILVAYRGVGQIGDCVRSVLRQVGPGVELVVVDNASGDDTLDEVRQVFDAEQALLPAAGGVQLQIVARADNGGYGLAANAGVAAARAERCLLLNQDLELTGSPEPLLARLDEDPRLALVGPRLRFPDGRLQLGLGRAHAPWRMVLSWVVPLGVPFLGARLARVETRPADYERPHADRPWISGAALAFRRSTWLALGGMDPAFFLYVEDVDLATRARAAGYRVGFEPAVEVLHREASGRSWPGPRALGWTFEGYLRHARRHHGRGGALATRVGLCGAALWRALLHAALGFGGARALDREKARAFAAEALRLARPGPVCSDPRGQAAANPR